MNDLIIDNKLLKIAIHLANGISDLHHVTSKKQFPQGRFFEKQNLEIMLADDDEDDRYFFAQALTELSPGIKLSTCTDGSELLNLLESEKPSLPDLIFLDLNMPRKNGFECLELLKQHALFRHIPVIIYSTSANPTQVEDTYNKGANLYIQKPDTFNSIKQILKRVFNLVPGDLVNQPHRNSFLFK